MKSLMNVARQLRPRAAWVAGIAAAVLLGCGGGGGDGGGAGTSTAKESPWGKVDLRGAHFAGVAPAVSAMRPNSLPAHTVGEAGVHRLDWGMDNAYDPRASLALSGPRVVASLLLAADGSLAPDKFIGILGLIVRVIPAGGAATEASVTLLCGGASPSGLFVALQRDAACEGISLDWAQRKLKLGALALSDGGGLDGTLSFISHEPAAATTASGASIRNCPLTPSGAEVALPDASTAACLAGHYEGTGDDGRACSVTIDAPTSGPPKIQVNVEGFTQTYTHLARRVGGVKEGSEVGEVNWTYWFSTKQTSGSLDDESDTEYLVANFSNLGILASSGGPVMGVGFLVGHATAPAGVAGPVDAKGCLVPVPLPQ